MSGAAVNTATTPVPGTAGAEPAARPTALLFTQHLIGLGVRKAGMSFWAEALAELGWDTRVVTTQLSLLSLLAGTPRLAAVPAADRNRWRQRGERLWNYVWVPVVHPASARVGLLDLALRPAYRLYPFLLPAAVRNVAADARLIVIESGAGLMLVDRLRRLAPQARLVYNASDRMAAVGFHPDLIRAERRHAPKFDLVRAIGRPILDDFGPDVRKAYVPQGLDKRPFDAAKASPYRGPGPHVVIAGDMNFDVDAVRVMAQAFPEASFHLFGRMPRDGLDGLANVRVHGEVRFETLVAYVKFADVGVAPYRPRSDLDYLADSSLKLIQYRYCRLPTVTPHFAAAGRRHMIGYDPRDAASIKAALAEALAYPRDTIAAHDVPSWREMIETVLRHVDLL